MKISITDRETYTLTTQTIDKLIRLKDGDAALLYLYMLRTHGKSTDKQAAEALKKSMGEINTATALLSRMRLIEVEADSPNTDAGSDVSNAADVAPIAEPQRHTQEEVIAEIKSGSGFTIVVEETTRRLGKHLSPDELLRLYGIYDNLRLPPEVILQLITHCISECRNSGGGRLPSIRYIEKVAYTWEREGVFTIERAEEYLKSLEARKSARGKIKQILQIRDRELSDTEKRYIDGWISMGFEHDVIAEAYDRTVVKTGGLKYPYMDTILKNWHDKGYHTAQQVDANDKRNKVGSYNSRASGRQSGQKHGEPNREDVERMARMLVDIKKES